MEIRQYCTWRRPDGTTSWRYRIKLENPTPWDVEIVEDGADFIWTLTGDEQLLAKNRERPYASRDDALSAAVRYVEDLETGIW